MSDLQVRYRAERQRTEKLSYSTKVIQGIGALPEAFQNTAFNILLLFYYNQVLGMPAILASAALGVALVIDAIYDPIIGSFSDGLRTRLGRRHPLMYAAALPMGGALFAAFYPPAGLSHLGLAFWLFATTVTARLAMSTFTIPWGSLFAELSSDYSERTVIVSYRQGVGWAGGLLFGFVVWTVIFKGTPDYPRGQLNPAAYPVFAVFLGVCATVATLVTTHFTRREIPYLLQPLHAPAPLRPHRVLADISRALANRDFLVLFLASLTFAGIHGTVTALGIYMQTYFWELRADQLVWYVFAGVGPFVALATASLLERWLDKRGVAVAALVLLVADGALIVGLGLLGLTPPDGSTALLALLVANEAFRQFLITSLGIQFTSMVADTLDVQELNTGKRQEGLFTSALSFSNKATTGLGTVAAGIVLDVIVKWSAHPDAANLPASKVTALAVIVGILAPCLYLVPAFLCSRYRITREAFRRLREALDARRASNASQLEELEEQDREGQGPVLAQPPELGQVGVQP